MTKRLWFIFVMTIICLIPTSFAQQTTCSVLPYSADYDYVHWHGGNFSLEDMGDTYQYCDNITHYQASANSNLGLTENDYWIAQSIQDGDRMNVTGVYFHMGSSYLYPAFLLDGNITFEIQTDSGANAPSGTRAHSLAEFNLSIDQIKLGGSSYSLDTLVGGNFSTNITLEANTKYWIVMKQDFGYTYYYLYVSRHTTGTYANGSASYSNNAGTTWINNAGYDWWFQLTEGTHEPSTNYYQWESSNHTLSASPTVTTRLTGGATMNIGAGETFAKNEANTAGTGQIIQVIYGGRLISIGNTTDYARIQAPRSAGTRGQNGVMCYGVSDCIMDWTVAEGYTSNSILYMSATYSKLELRNSKFYSNYSGSAAYALQIAAASIYDKSQAINCTFSRPSYNYYPVYLSTVPTFVFIDCEFSSPAYATAIINYNQYQIYNPAFIDCTHRGSALTVSDIANGYSSTAFVLGHTISPRVVDGSGNPIENVTMSIIPQFRDYDGVEGAFNGGWWNNYSYVHDWGIGYQMSDRHRFANYYISNSNGYFYDDLNNPIAWIPSTAHVGTDEGIHFYYGGNKLQLRPYNDLTWNNDGTDYGYILSFSSDDCGEYSIVDYNTTYTDTVVLDCAGGVADETYGSAPFITLAISFILIFVARRLEGKDAMKILYFMLSIAFIIITLFTNRILAEGEGYTDIVNIMTNGMNLVIFVFVLLIMFFMFNFVKDMMASWGKINDD